jgi:ADP-ribose pyrophosphatase
MAKEIVRQPNKKAKILKSEIIYEGKAFGVRRDELIEPTGVRTLCEVVTHPGSVVVLPLLPDGRIVMFVSTTRHGSICGSGRANGARENPQTGAQRELIEETGHRAKSSLYS